MLAGGHLSQFLKNQKIRHTIIEKGEVEERKKHSEDKGEREKGGHRAGTPAL